MYPESADEGGRFPKVDALFSGEPPPEPEPAGPRVRLMRRLLWVAVPLDVLGIPCWTGVPGAVLTLWAYLSLDADVARVEAGQYLPEDAEQLMRLRSIASMALYFSVFSFLAQTMLLSLTNYGARFGAVIDGLLAWLASLA